MPLLRAACVWDGFAHRHAHSPAYSAVCGARYHAGKPCAVYSAANRGWAELFPYNDRSRYSDARSDACSDAYHAGRNDMYSGAYRDACLLGTVLRTVRCTVMRTVMHAVLCTEAGAEILCTALRVHTAGTVRRTVVCTVMHAFPGIVLRAVMLTVICAGMCIYLCISVCIALSTGVYINMSTKPFVVMAPKPFIVMALIHGRCLSVTTIGAQLHGTSAV